MWLVIASQKSMISEQNGQVCWTAQKGPGLRSWSGLIKPGRMERRETIFLECTVRVSVPGTLYLAQAAMKPQSSVSGPINDVAEFGARGICSHQAWIQYEVIQHNWTHKWLRLWPHWSATESLWVSLRTEDLTVFSEFLTT